MLINFVSVFTEISPVNKISISSYVTKQKILSNETKQMVTDLPKYRYELVLQSNSIYNGNVTKTWIYGARVFIDSLEVTREQSPDGFSAIINTEPTIIFRYDFKLKFATRKLRLKFALEILLSNLFSLLYAIG